MNDTSIDCSICQRGTRIRRIIRCHGPFAALLGTVLVVVGALCVGAGLLIALTSIGKRDGPLIAITVVIPVLVGALLLMLVGALAARKKSVLWCDACWATSDCMDITVVEVPTTGPGSQFGDMRFPVPGAGSQCPSTDP